MTEERSVKESLESIHFEKQKAVILLQDGTTPPAQMGRAGDLAYNGTTLYIKWVDGEWKAV